MQKRRIYSLLFEPLAIIEPGKIFNQSNSVWKFYLSCVFFSTLGRRKLGKKKKEEIFFLFLYGTKFTAGVVHIFFVCVCHKWSL